MLNKSNPHKYMPSDSKIQESNFCCNLSPLLGVFILSNEIEDIPWVDIPLQDIPGSLYLFDSIFSGTV